MATRVMGPKGSRRRNRFVLGPMLLVALFALLVVGGAQAVHDEGVFALEGNAITGGTACTDAAQTTPQGCEPANPVSQGFANEDWGSVYAGTDTAQASVFLTDDTLHNGVAGIAGQGDSILTGGSTKDINDLTDAGTGDPIWLWKQTNTTSVQDKDDIEHAMAAQYTVDRSGTNQSCGSAGPQAECELLYFGADRFSNSGDAVMGFWLFKSKVETAGPDAAGNGTFTGNHTARVVDPDTGDIISHGDVLIVSDFRSGGKAPQIQIYEWVDSGGSASTHLDLVGGGPNPASCTQAPPEGGKAGKDPVPPVENGDDFCATANQFVVHSPWKYDAKDNSGGTDGNGTLGTPLGQNLAPNTKFGVAEFMEGGINLTALGFGKECFSSFMAESRAAHSVTSTLSDFTLGTFGECETTLTTTPADGSGTPLTDDDPVNGLPDTQIGTGSAGVDVTDNASVSVTGAEDWTGTVSFFLCGPIDPATCEDGGVPAGTKDVSDSDTTATSDVVNLTEVGRYCWRGVFEATSPSDLPGDTDASTGECFEVTPVTPTLTTSAVEAGSLLSPTIYGGLADLNGDGVGDSLDDSTDFYGDTDIINGALDCNAWGTGPGDENAGANGDGAINGSDDCTLIGYDGTADGVTIEVVDGLFDTADGVDIADGTALPAVFNAADPDNAGVGPSDFAWSTIFGKVDSNGNETIDGDDCAFNLIGAVNIIGDSTCGSANPNPNDFGKVDLNGDGKATSADSCTDGCFLGRDVANGLVLAGTVPFGSTLYDIATLTGTANQPGDNGGTTPGQVGSEYPSINATNGAPADGTITFTLVGPDGQTTDCSTLATSDDVNELNPEDATVSGDDDYQTSGFTPNSPGDYHWKASYTGDSPNTLDTSHNDACDEAGEDVTVQQVPSGVTTRQSVFPQDTASITAPSGGDLLGNVRFTLHDSLAECQSRTDIKYDSLDITISGASPQTASTDNTTYRIVDGTTHYWNVSYASDNPAQLSSSSECTETTAVTYAGNDTGITLP